VVAGKYIAEKADMKCYQRRYWVTKPVPRLGQMKYFPFWEYAMKHLCQQYPWSPEEIVNRWKLLHPDRGKYPCVSTQTFYTYLYHRRPDVCKKLLSQREKRKKRVKNKTQRHMIPNRIWIDDRPAEIGSITHTDIATALP
jgi:IS30 family transposase